MKINESASLGEALLKTREDVLIVIELNGCRPATDELIEIMQTHLNVQIVVISNTVESLGLGEGRFELPPLTNFWKAAMFF